MFLFSKPEIRQLFHNSQPDQTGKDHYPVTKLYLPRTGCTWLVTEIDLNDPGRILSLYDLRQGVITYDYMNLNNIMSLKTIDGQSVTRDPYFTRKYNISVYLQAAFALGFITEADTILGQYAAPKPQGPS